MVAALTASFARRHAQVTAEGLSLAEVERDLVIAALERNQWNQTRSAAFLQISRNVLVYRMQKYRLGPYRNLPPDAAIAPPDEEVSTGNEYPEPRGKD